MTNHRSCCCGGCNSPFRRFVRCDGDELYLSHLITLAKFDELNLSEGVIYLFDSPICGSFCGYFVCDPQYPEGYDDWCLPGFCDCDDPESNPYLLRPSDLDPNPFELLQDLGDEFNTGDCCDWRCSNRIEAICDENPSTCDDGYKVRGCECVNVDNLNVLIDVSVSGPFRQDFDMIYDYYDCNGDFQFKTPGPPWTTEMQWSYLGASLVATEYCSDGTTPQTRTYRMDWQANRTLTIRLPETCPPCGNGRDLFRCYGTISNPTCISTNSHDIGNTWPTWTDDLRFCKWFKISIGTDATSPFGNQSLPASFQWVPQPASDPFDPHAASTIRNPCNYTGDLYVFSYGSDVGLYPAFGWDYPESDGSLSACSGTSTVGNYQKHMVLKPSTACIGRNSFCVGYAAPLSPELPGPKIDVRVGFGLDPVNQEPDPC